MWTFNYGEWTEAYVFLRLLGNGRIYGANADFERDESVYMDIINVIRHEKNHILKFLENLITMMVPIIMYLVKVTQLKEITT